MAITLRPEYGGPTDLDYEKARDILGATTLQEKLKKQQNAQDLLNQYKVMKTRYLTANGNEYPIYQDTKTGTYFIIDKNGKRSDFTNPAGIELISKNKNWTISKENYENKMGSTANKKTTTTTTTTTPTPTSSGGGGSTTGGSPSPSNAYMQQVLDEYNEIKQKLYDLEHPRVLSAREAAEHFDIPYDEAQFLKEYNDATHEYYDDMMNEQDRLRSVYARNNSQYAQQLANAYLDSYRNAAPTATGQGVRAANALSSMIQNQQSINENDYGMLQSYNNLASARDAELANNPLLAKQKYNDLGTYLSTLTANHNTSDVKQYVDQLDAYGQMYAANRLLAAADAEAAATRYSGLTQAAQSNAQSVANGYANNGQWQNLYNYYYNTSNGNNKYASKAVANLTNQGLKLGSGS